MGEIHTKQFLKSTERPDSMDEENTGPLKDQQPHHPEEHDEQALGDEIIYADDANMIIDPGATQIARKILTYGALTATRDVKIHWGKVGIVARLEGNGALKSQLPRPFNIAIVETSGKALGKHIRTSLTSVKVN